MKSKSKIDKQLKIDSKNQDYLNESIESIYSTAKNRSQNIDKLLGWSRYIKTKKKCKKLGIIDEIKDRRHFVKPSEKKRRAKERAIPAIREQQ